MGCVVCLLVPDFPLAALVRADPELRERAVASSDGAGPHAQLSFVSAQARRAGVRPGMTAGQGCALAPGLIVVPRSPACERSAADALLDVAESFSPVVEESQPGCVFFQYSCSRCSTQWESPTTPTQWDSSTTRATRAVQPSAWNAVRRVRTVGMEAAVGIAANKELAGLAARCGRRSMAAAQALAWSEPAGVKTLERQDEAGICVVEPGGEVEFLDRLPLAPLDLDPELEQTLARWGIRRLGELARLDPRELGSRLGAAGVELARLAHAESSTPVIARPHAEVFVETAEPGYGIATLEPLSFVLRGLLERLVARLKLRGLVAGDLWLALDLEDHRRDQRRVAVAAATNEVRSLLALLILNLEQSPPPAAVEALRISVQPRPPRPLQTDMFLPPAPAPERLQATLARLAALCGPERVGALYPANAYRPEAVELRTFAPSPTVAASASPASQNVNRMVLRALRPAREVEVMCERGRPRFVRGADLCARVVSLGGPWRRQGEWWRDSFARDYYDLMLADGGVYRMFYDLGSGRWFVDGIYD